MFADIASLNSVVEESKFVFICLFKDDGCYNFQIVVANDFYSTINDASLGTGVVVSDNAWQLDYDSNEANSQMVTCSA